jgi:hypothetical protein
MGRSFFVALAAMLTTANPMYSGVHSTIAIAQSENAKNQNKAAEKADKNLILIGCLAQGPQTNTYIITTDGSNGVEGGQSVQLIGGDKGTLEGQVGQKVQVSGQIDAKGPGLKKTVADVAAAAAPIAGAVATGGVGAAAGVATGGAAKNASEAEQKKQVARVATLPRFTVIAVKGLDEGCDEANR